MGLALRRFLPEFAARFPASPHALQVLRRLARCHTGNAGWSLWQCARCQAAHWRPLGCGDRHCPDCQGQRREQWLEAQRESLLPVRYYHWVFTLPAELRPLALQNPVRLYKALFDAAAGTLLQFGRERLGAELGLSALLHTWGQTLVAHPHVHCLVTGGGLALDADGLATWRGPKQQRYLFPLKAVAAMYAGKFLDQLQSLRRAGELIFEGTLAAWTDERVWAGIVAGLRAQPWIVFAQGSVVGPEAVLEYLGRYTHRVALANARLLAVTDSTVSFRYKDYRQGGAVRTMTLAGADFAHRLSLHVLPRGFTKIRHYGILGNNRRQRTVPLARAALARSRWLMALALHAVRPPAPREAAACPRCGADDLTCLARLDPSGKFIPLAGGARRARLRTGDPPAVRDTS